MAYLAEYTDTFGGEANYCWVRRATITRRGEKESMKGVLKRARAELGLTGLHGRITLDDGDEIHWVPRGMCTILMVRWDDTPAE